MYTIGIRRMPFGLEPLTPEKVWPTNQRKETARHEYFFPLSRGETCVGDRKVTARGGLFGCFKKFNEVTYMRTNKKTSTKLVAIAIVCVTLIVVVGAWFYVEQQKLSQEDKRLQQEKETVEYQQSQINDRVDRERVCSADLSTLSANDYGARMHYGC